MEIRRQILTLKNIPDLLSDEEEIKIMGNVDFSYLSNLQSSIGHPNKILKKNPKPKSLIPTFF